MLFINHKRSLFLVTTLLIMAGCQSLDKELAAPKAEPEVVVELTPMEKLHQSPNQYLLNQPTIAPEVNTKFSQALTTVKAQQLEQAKAQFLALTIAAPTLSGPWLQLGDIARQEKAIKHAIAHYQQAIYVNKHNYFAHNRLATLLREQGEFEQAQKHYQQALEAWPAFVPARKNLAILLDLYMGKATLALEEYQTVAALNNLNKLPEDRQLKGWIADLSRRVAAEEKRKQRIAEQEAAKQQADEVATPTGAGNE